MIIGLGHQARVGKDTVAFYLARKYGYTTTAFAGRLKRAAQTIFDLSPDQLNTSLKEMVDPRWQMSPREILQKMGTDAMRRTFGDQIWVQACLTPYLVAIQHGKRPKVAITDVRFPNEANAVLDLGGAVIRIDRPGHQVLKGDTAAHPSETALLDYPHWTHTIVNDGTITALHQKVDKLMGQLGIFPTS